MTSDQKQEITEILEQFGLGAKDREAYLALLRRGQTTISPLASDLRIPPTTAQSVIQRLTKLGLVEVTKSKSRSVYAAHDPIRLKRLVEKQLQEVSRIVPWLQELRGETGGASKIRVYHRERMTDIFHQALAAKSKQVFEIVAAKDLQDILGEKFHFTKRRVAAGIKLKSLRIEAHEIKRYSRSTHVRELREARFLPREMDFRCSIMFWDDTAAFFTTKSEGLAWTVWSPELRKMLEQIFMMLWSVSRKMETEADR